MNRPSNIARKIYDGLMARKSKTTILKITVDDYYADSGGGIDGDSALFFVG